MLGLLPASRSVGAAEATADASSSSTGSTIIGVDGLAKDNEEIYSDQC